MSDGHARNFLLPKGHALKATDGAVDSGRLDATARDLRDAQDRDGAADDRLGAGAQGHHHHGQVRRRGQALRLGHRADVATAVEEQTGIDLDRKNAPLDEPIKSLGEHTVTAKLHSDVEFPITVEVVTA